MSIQPVDLLTDEAINRPLFEEPSEASEREDPWSGPKGFVIGGMSLPTKQELSQQYFDAAHLLLESIKRNAWEDYKLVNPALFLYRHAVELVVKGITGTATKTHNLSQLADLLNASALKRDNAPAPRWVIARLKEIAAIDPGSTAFRYARNYSQKAKCDVEVDGEVYINLHHLQRAMLALYCALCGRVPEVVTATYLDNDRSDD